MATVMLSPGANRFTFDNFEIIEEDRETIREAVAKEVIELLSESTDDASQRARQKAASAATLRLAELEFDQASENDDPLNWWPQSLHLQLLFPVAQMLFVIPAWAWYFAITLTLPRCFSEECFASSGCRAQNR